MQSTPLDRRRYLLCEATERKLERAQGKKRFLLIISGVVAVAMVIWCGYWLGRTLQTNSATDLLWLIGLLFLGSMSINASIMFWLDARRFRANPRQYAVDMKFAGAWRRDDITPGKLPWPGHHEVTSHREIIELDGTLMRLRTGLTRLLDLHQQSAVVALPKTCAMVADCYAMFFEQAERELKKLQTALDMLQLADRYQNSPYLTPDGARRLRGTWAGRAWTMHKNLLRLTDNATIMCDSLQELVKQDSAKQTNEQRQSLVDCERQEALATLETLQGAE